MSLEASALHRIDKRVHNKFQIDLGALRETSAANRFVERIDSRGTQSKDYAGLGMVPPLLKNTESIQYGSLNEYDFSIKNERYTSGFKVSDEDLESDNLGVLSSKISESALRIISLENKLAFGILSEGETTSIGYDDKPLFAADHEFGVSGAQSNIVSVAGSASDVLAAIEQGFSEAKTRLRSFKDDQGELSFSDIPLDLITATPVDNEDNLMKLFNTTMLNNSDNIFTSQSAIVSSSRLTNPSPTALEFYILNRALMTRAVVLQEQFMKNDRREDFDNDAQKFKNVWKGASAAGRWELGVKVKITLS